MATDYKVISCDDHLDLAYLPADFWTRRMPAEYKDRAPHVEERNGETVWICDGKVWGGWRGGKKPAGSNNAPKSNYTAYDRGGITDTSDLRAGVAKLRLADMDRDGVYAHVIFGPVFSIKTEDADLRDACYRVYNDSLAELCAEAPERLLGVPMLPEFPEPATKELKRLAGLGFFKQANLQIADAKPRLNDPSWEPFWNAIEETGMILSFHIGVGGNRPGDPAIGKPAATFTATKLYIEQFLDPFVDLFAWGILERHPKLKIVLAESGLGWLPWVVQELDNRFGRLNEASEFWSTRGGTGLTLKPSELFKRQVYATFQDDEVALSLLPYYGDGHVMWASDYPHPDSTWPNSRSARDRQMAHLSRETIKALTHDNAAKLYGLNF